MEKIGFHETLHYYAAKIDEYPESEVPDAFGQHINAEISSKIIESSQLIDSIISLEPRTGGG